MPEEQVISTPESPVKKAELGFVGILIGIVTVAFFLFTLNYFNIINLPANLPHRQMQQKQNQTSQEAPSDLLAKSKRINPVLEAKAEKAGYYIIWQGDPKDMTGRTILASKQRGPTENFNLPEDNLRIMGIFKSIEKILNSSDVYFILENPIDNTKTKVRLVAKTKQDQTQYTAFEIINLSLIPDEKNNLGFEPFFEYSGQNEDFVKIGKIIKTGDVIDIFLNGYKEGDNYGRAIKTIVKRDGENNYIANTVDIRRFEGKAQVNKELK